MIKPLNRISKFMPGMFSFAYIGFLISQLCLGSTYIGQFPLRAYFIFTAFILYLFIHLFGKNKIDISSAEKKIVTVFLMFIGCSIISFIFARIFYAYDVSLPKFFFLLVKYLLQLFSVFVLTGYFIRANSDHKLAKIIVILAALSGLVAFCQFLGIDFFWKIKYFLTTNTEQYITNFILRHPDRSRAVGLSLYFISLSYEMLIAFPLSLFLTIKSTGKTKIFYALAVLLIFLGIIASKTISAYLALFIMMIFWLLYKKQFNLIGLLLLFIGLLSIFFPDYVYSILKTLRIRVGFWIVAVLVFLRYPLGIPFLREYGVYSSQFYDVVRSFCGDISGSSPHNQFLNTFISYGALSIAPYIIFIRLIFHKLRASNNLRILFLKLSVVAYFAHAFFHNLGPFYNDVFIWVIMGYYIFSMNMPGKNEKIC